MVLGDRQPVGGLAHGRHRRGLDEMADIAEGLEARRAVCGSEPDEVDRRVEALSLHRRHEPFEIVPVSRQVTDAVRQRPGLAARDARHVVAALLQQADDARGDVARSADDADLHRLLGRERGVERGGGRSDLGELADERERLGRADQPVHAGVLPLDARRAVVADRVERAEQRLPPHRAVPGRDERPPAARVGPGPVRAEHAVAPVEVGDRLLHVHVEDVLGEVEHERDVVQLLPDEVRRVEVEPEALAVADRLEGVLGGPVVVRDLGRVHLEREAHADLFEDVEDRVPAVGEVLVAARDELVGCRREHRDGLPDRRPGEAVDRLHAELRGDAGGVLQVLRGALPHALRVAVAPDPVRQDVAVPLVDRVVAHRLAGQVIRDRVDLQPVALEDVEPALHVLRVVPTRDVEVVAPAGDLEAVVAPLAGESGHLFERQVGPLAGEQSDRTRHRALLRVGSSDGCRDARGGADPGGFVLARPLDRIEHALHREPLGERRVGVGALGDRRHQVDDLVAEAVLVAEHVAGGPPGGDVRMLRLGDQDLREALPVVGSGAVVELQAVEVFEVERERALVARDLDRQRVLAPCRESRRLERDERAVREAPGEDRDVVDGDLADSPRRRCPTDPDPSPAAAARSRSCRSCPTRNRRSGRSRTGSCR